MAQKVVIPLNIDLAPVLICSRYRKNASSRSLNILWDHGHPRSGGFDGARQRGELLGLPED